MKTSFLFLLSLGFFIGCSFSSSAQSFPDTTGLLAGNSIGSALLFLEKPANVIYPSSLAKHREQSLDYVEKFSEEKGDYITWLYNQGKKYFPKVSSILKLYNLPEELKVLMALESSFNGNAVSKAGAVGYWQMMRASAKQYGLQTAGAKKKDERKNLSKSTLAAAKYFRDRFSKLDDDLLLIVASYNCGLGGVLRAIKKSEIENADFWDIKKYLPAETRKYVMNFIALNVLLWNYETFRKKELVFTPEYLLNPANNNILPVKTD